MSSWKRERVGALVERRGIAFVLAALVGLPTFAAADDKAAIEARVASWGRNCKNAVAARHPGANMAQIEVGLVGLVRDGIAAGKLTLADVDRGGLAYEYRVRGAKGGDVHGFCKTDGKGDVTDVTEVDPAGDEKKADARKIEQLVDRGRAKCKEAVVARYPKAKPSEVTVHLGATLRQSLDAGEMTSADVERGGLSYNFEVRGSDGAKGYCNTDGKGAVSEVQSFD